MITLVKFGLHFRGGVTFLAFQTLVNFERRLAEQEQPAQKQYQVAA